MKVQTRECSEFKKEWWLPPVTGWLYGKVLELRGNTNSNLAYLQMSKAETLCTCGGHCGPSLSCNDIAIAQVTQEKAKRGRDIGFWRAVSHSHRMGWFGHRPTTKRPLPPSIQDSVRVRCSWGGLHWKGHWVANRRWIFLGSVFLGGRG